MLRIQFFTVLKRKSRKLKNLVAKMPKALLKRGIITSIDDCQSRLVPSLDAKSHPSHGQIPSRNGSSERFSYD